MIYTIGIKANYDRYLKEYKLVEKEVYGSVWGEFAEADAACKFATNVGSETFDVYGVEASWEKDTIKHPDRTIIWRSLNKRAKIIKCIKSNNLEGVVLDGQSI